MTSTWGAAHQSAPPHRPPLLDNNTDRARTVALVDRACDGDVEAFGQLYDRHMPGIFRFVLHRVSSRTLAEDLTSETFIRALRSIDTFHWQGKDFGAWLTTIARNLIADHFRSCRHRLEVVACELPDSELPEQRTPADGPEDEVCASLATELLVAAVQDLPAEQRDCLLMRFVQGLSIAQTAQVLDRSEGAIKQLQLRAIRRLARALPKDACT